MRTTSSLILILVLVVSCNTNKIKNPAVFKKYTDYTVDSNIKEEMLRPGLFSSTGVSDAMIDQLKSGEHLVIDWNLTGCFYHESRNMAFVKIDSVIYCVLPGDLVMKLNPEQVDIIRNMEATLYHQDQAIPRNVPFDLKAVMQPVSCGPGTAYSFCVGKRRRIYSGRNNYADPFTPIMTSVLLFCIPVKN